MIDVKQAANIANENLIDLLGQDAISGVRLEEVELVQQGDFIAEDVPNEITPEDADEWDSSYWFVTVSYLPKNPNILVPERTQRLYKVFKLEAATGNLIAMKMRAVA